MSADIHHLLGGFDGQNDRLVRRAGGEHFGDHGGDWRHGAHARSRTRQPLGAGPQVATIFSQ